MDPMGLRHLHGLPEPDMQHWWMPYPGRFDLIFTAWKGSEQKNHPKEKIEI